MDAERTIAPGPSRLERARRAGIRPRSKWLGCGLLALALAAVLDAATASDISALMEQLEAALLAPHGHQAMVALRSFVVFALEWAAFSSLLVLLLISALALVTGTWGPMDKGQRASLGHLGPRRGGAVLFVALGVVTTALLVVGLFGVVAGGARAADASAQGLALVWHIWGLRVLSTVGLVLTAGGVVELWLERRHHLRALYQSVAQARDERRRLGGRRA